jgi:hypothetical protein
LSTLRFWDSLVMNNLTSAVLAPAAPETRAARAASLFTQNSFARGRMVQKPRPDPVGLGGR